MSPTRSPHIPQGTAGSIHLQEPQNHPGATQKSAGKKKTTQWDVSVCAPGSLERAQVTPRMKDLGENVRNVSNVSLPAFHTGSVFSLFMFNSRIYGTELSQSQMEQPTAVSQLLPRAGNRTKPVLGNFLHIPTAQPWHL